MSCDVGEATESLENELCCISLYLYIYEICSFSNLSVTSPTSQLIIQLFRRFTYVAAHSPTLPLLRLRHSSFSNPSFASPTSQTLHLRHLQSRPSTTIGFNRFMTSFFFTVRGRVVSPQTDPQAGEQSLSTVQGLHIQHIHSSLLSISTVETIFAI